MKRTSAFSALMLTLGAIQAQGLHESIGVDGKYVREVIIQDKIYTLPKKLNFTLESTPPAYSLTGIPTPFRPQGVAMPTVTPFADRQVPDTKGYLDFCLGSWLDGNLSAGYRFVNTERTVAGAFIQANTSLLWKPEISELTSDIHRRLADGRVGVYASHRFDGKGTLDGTVLYGLSGFNYYGYSALQDLIWLPAGTKADVPTQTVNEVRGDFGWHSTRNRHGFSYDAGLDVSYLGYRSLYLPSPSGGVVSPDGRYSGLTRLRGDRETGLRLNASARKQWSGGSELGADLRTTLMLYTKTEDESGEQVSPDNYGAVGLTPYYRFSRGLLNIRVGADIDLILNAGPAGDRYPAFRIAPDVRLDWRKGGVGLYLNVLGGTELRTLAWMRSLDWYTMPCTGTTNPVYSPLDAALGANFGPYGGFSAGASFRYKVTRGMPEGGWYMAYLNYGGSQMPGISFPGGAWPSPESFTPGGKGLNIHGMSVEAHAAYTLGRILEIKASGTYQPQSGRTGYFNGYDRPRWTASLSALVRPVSQLSIEVGYEYRGVRNIYSSWDWISDTKSDLPVVDDTERDSPLSSLRLPDLTLLNARAGWQFTPKIGIFIQAANLLNRHDAILPLTPTSGISVTGGVNLLF